MIPPHELKNKQEFTKVMRGYSSSEVDEYIDFLIQKYTEMYRENDEMERRLQTMQAKLDSFQNEEESIRSAFVNAQRASSKIINEANERADVIVRSAKTNCDRIVADFQEQIKAEQQKLKTMRETVAGFKSSLFEQYQTHIEYIEEIAPEEINEGNSSQNDDYYTKQAIMSIKNDIKAGTVTTTPTKPYEPPIQKPAVVIPKSEPKPEPEPEIEPAYTKYQPIDENELELESEPESEPEPVVPSLRAESHKFKYHPTNQTQQTQQTKPKDERTVETVRPAENVKSKIQELNKQLFDEENDVSQVNGSFAEPKAEQPRKKSAKNFNSIEEVADSEYNDFIKTITPTKQQTTKPVTRNTQPDKPITSTQEFNMVYSDVKAKKNK